MASTPRVADDAAAIAERMKELAVEALRWRGEAERAREREEAAAKAAAKS